MCLCLNYDLFFIFFLLSLFRLLSVLSVFLLAVRVLDSDVAGGVGALFELGRDAGEKAVGGAGALAAQAQLLGQMLANKLVQTAGPFDHARLLRLASPLRRLQKQTMSTINQPIKSSLSKRVTLSVNPFPGSRLNR
jgi:hypothetical protein